ncbi:MAG: helix-turn-helix domain-containing protein, partial [Nanoarchaeota archaeon]
KMMQKTELIGKIKDYFDLNVYETKVWLALLSKGIASAGEVADLSGVPRSRTYDVLESLEKRGFAIVKIGKPVKYLGVKPKTILEKMKNNVKKDADDRILSLSTIKDTDEFAKLEQLYHGGLDPVKREDISASLKGKSNISNQLREIIQDAHKEVIICTSADELKNKSKLFTQTFNLLKNNNIKLRVALSGNENEVKELSKKFEVKFFNISIEAKFFIIDRKEILFYVTKADAEEDIAIWLNSEFFSQAFASLFDKATGAK